jgi:anti-sigma B factor antagonist
MNALPSPALQIVRVARGTTMVLTVTGEVDIATVAILRRALANARAGFVTVILDLHNVSFFGAAGLNAVAAAYKYAPALGDFRLRDPSPAVQRVLDISGLDRIVPIEVTTAASPAPAPGSLAVPAVSSTGDSERPDRPGRPVSGRAVSGRLVPSACPSGNGRPGPGGGHSAIGRSMVGGQAFPSGPVGPAGAVRAAGSGVYAVRFRSSSGTAGVYGERRLSSATVGSVDPGADGTVGWASVAHGIGRGATRGLS